MCSAGLGWAGLEPCTAVEEREGQRSAVAMLRHGRLSSVGFCEVLLELARFAVFLHRI